MKLQARQQHKASIPTASMADIAFLLIIFFMVTITFEVDKTQVVLPKTQIRLEIPKKSAYISIDGSGQIKVSGGEELSVPVAGVEDVVSFAAGVVAGPPLEDGRPRPFVLKADKEVEYRAVDQVIDALKRAKVDVIYLLSEQETVDDLSSGG